MEFLKHRSAWSWALRILVAAVFFVSGLAKLFPITAFEKQIFDLFGGAFCNAQYLARFILSLEFAIAVGMLQPHFFKRFVLPVTALVLVAFNVHLGLEIYRTGGGEGSCGCFGQWLPMTPMEAFWKNVVTLGLVGALAYLTEEAKGLKHRFGVILLIFFACATTVLALRPFCPCAAPVEMLPVESMEETEDWDGGLALDSAALGAGESAGGADIDSVAVAVVPTVKPVEGTPKELPAAERGPEPVRSVFAGYRQFGPQTVALDKGKKIVCMFHPDCDHCKETAAKICAMPRGKGAPEVVILFLDEDTDRIPAFFEAAGCRAPYQVLGHGPFFDLLGSGSDTPGVFCLWNGNVVASFEGSGANAFDAARCRESLQWK